MGTQEDLAGLGKHLEGFSLLMPGGALAKGMGAGVYKCQFIFDIGKISPKD